MKIDFIDLFGYIALYFGVTATILLDLPDGLAFCNPKYLKEEHEKLNKAGVIILTIIYNILWLPYAILYWTYKLITLYVLT